ncbi:cell division protein FtsQ [Actinoplanes ianthinogenes]|uniref:Cell division protein FtsQ n=1 Tax=Actinoplanes ianthinogenes TaxID=122358 RepID=A0ABM7M1E4_9ACTN|nr:FtsQ-type POTRA domain-containing protein [Actinoplanes ianthinogenes]BCJ45440.1 cell division protein FtsQ [Actinoplanes ianthinogenes]GGR49059.1 cell division protein FtsQ [Actinoplanes ianthinogenes]
MAGSGTRNWRLVRADTDAVPPSARRFMARARQRRLRAALPWLIGAGALLVAGGLAWLIYGTAVLGVKTVDVVGAQTLDPEQVRAAAAVPADRPLARVDPDEVEARVRGLAPVDRVTVTRSWPSTLRIEVVERVAVAAVPGQGGFTLIDDDGVAFRTVAEAPAGLPLARLATPGPADANTASALIVLGALSDDLREQLVAIAVPTPVAIRLELSKGRVVVWGDDTQSDQKSKVATALIKRKGTEFDVSAPRIVTIR